jgi:uncharacterized membrane protein
MSKSGQSSAVDPYPAEKSSASSHAPAESDRGLVPLHRLEAFSDAVFAFAVTLLVVSLEVPKSARELFAAARGFVAFGICFAFLMMFWIDHARFFKRYPLNDARTVTLNMLLLFVLLLYVYPLKFLFSMLSDTLLWGLPAAGIDSPTELRGLMVIYGLGFLALNLILLLMKRNVRSFSVRLALSPADQARLQGSIQRNAAGAAVAAGSVLVALFTLDNGLVCGCMYMSLGPINWLLGVRTRRRVQALGRL